MTDKLNEQQKERLAEAGQAAVNMSHGIKNIAQSIRSGQEVMDKALDLGDIKIAKRTWSILKQNLDRIQKLSLNMLKFTKDEPLNLKSCHFNHLVESAVATIRPQADQQHATLVIQADEHLKSVPIDADQIQDAIINLLINALEAVESKTGRIVVQTESDEISQQAILRVSDNGKGIDNPDQIFTPFYSTKSNAGAGLGLTIAKNIIESHHGTIQAQNLDEGSVFTVRIPLEQPQ
jgi:signal transduction histidine kinase